MNKAMDDSLLLTTHLLGALTTYRHSESQHFLAFKYPAYNDFFVDAMNAVHKATLQDGPQNADAKLLIDVLGSHHHTTMISRQDKAYCLVYFPTIKVD